MEVHTLKRPIRSFVTNLETLVSYKQFGLDDSLFIFCQVSTLLFGWHVRRKQIFCKTSSCMVEVINYALQSSLISTPE